MDAALEAMSALLGQPHDSHALRRAEAYVEAMDQRALDALFLAMPMLDRIVRREVLVRRAAEGQ